MAKRNIEALWPKAAAFAARAHEHQARKDGVTPYFSHPARVAMTVACVFGFTDEHILAAAFLHDTIEDTCTDYDALHDQFGGAVADIVAALTKDMRLPEPQREVEYDRQLAAGPWEARLIKLADVYDNLLDTPPGPSRKNQVERANRALRLTAKDDRLVKPREIVADLIKQKRGTRG